MAKTMSIDEFQKAGYLQEVNRQFLHPLGLALQIRENPDGSKRLHAITDDRSDPLGIRFEPGLLSHDKAIRIEEEMNTKAQERAEQLGYVIQPVGE